MINNRQNGRRRGRGGPRPQGIGGRSDGGNRQDIRQRGNAPQLHEKYKAMARDAQLAGDRVQTEYYLQFADHYFRILNESRARFEEQRPQRAENGEDFEEDDQDSMAADDGGDSSDGAPGRYDRDDRGPRERAQVRPERGNGEERAQRADRDNGNDRSERDERDDREDRPRARQQRSFVPREAAEERPGIDLDRLPPAIARSEDSDSHGDGEDDRPRPVRRPRRPRDDAPVAA